MHTKLKKIVISVMSIFKIKNVIILESNADYSDNTRAFYEYLIRKNYNDKYKIYWFVNDGKKFKNRECKNVRFISMWKNVTQKTFIQWIKYFWIVKNAKYLISSNRALLKLNKKSIAINLNHGYPFKNIKGLNVVPKDIDMLIVPSDFCIGVYVDMLEINSDKMKVLGNARDDVLFRKTDTEKKLSEYQNYDKIIIWLPTFRQTKNNNRIDSHFDFPLGLPIIYNEEELIKLNDYLAKKNVLILFKLHPAQDTSFFKTNSLSNIKILDDNYLIEKDVELCEAYKITDAMITDYSSVYFDYMLLDKMIGFTVDDFEEYRKVKGFAYDKPYDYMPGPKIKNIKDLYKFIDCVINNKDNYKQKRNEVKKLFHKYTDSNSAKRLVDFLDL